MSDCPCELISFRDFCKYVKGIDLDNATGAVELANIYLCDCIGQVCFDLLCIGENEELNTIKENMFFKIFYARLIEYYWLVDCGDGQNEATGFTRKKSDELSEFEVISTKDLKTKLCSKKDLLDQLEIKFKDWFKEQCFQCAIKKETSCGCGNTCNKCKSCNRCKKNCGCQNDYSFSNDMATI